MTDNKISRKLELELKPQYKFFPSSKDRSSTQLSTREFQAKFFDADGQSYNCEDNKVWLSFGPSPRIYITSEFKGEEAKRLNYRLDSEDTRTFQLQKVSLNDRCPVDVYLPDLTPPSKAEKPDEFWLKWTPKEEHLVVTGGSSTKMKQIIFHLFNFVYFHDGDGSPRGETIADTDGLAASKAKHLHLNFNCDEWGITISQNPKYNPKHVGRIQRKGGGLFDETEVKKCIEMLDFVFSFVRGAWCKSVCLVGYDVSGECVWVSLSPPPELSISSPPKPEYYYRDFQLKSTIPSLVKGMSGRE